MQIDSRKQRAKWLLAGCGRGMVIYMFKYIGDRFGWM